MACEARICSADCHRAREHNNVFMFRVIPDLASRLPILYAKSAEGIKWRFRAALPDEAFPTRQFMVATVYVYCWSVRKTDTSNSRFLERPELTREH